MFIFPEFVKIFTKRKPCFFYGNIFMVFIKNVSIYVITLQVFKVWMSGVDKHCRDTSLLLVWSTTPHSSEKVKSKEKMLTTIRKRVKI